MYRYLLGLLMCYSLVGCSENSSSNSETSMSTEDNTMAPSAIDEKEQIQPTFVHTVFFWMKEDLTEEEAKFFEEGMEKLGQVPSIHSYKWGKPAGTPREVVDNSYTYAWIVDFKTSEDQDAYQVDPIHQKFIDESQHLWTKVQVYDTILE